MYTYSFIHKFDNYQIMYSVLFPINEQNYSDGFDWLILYRPKNYISRIQYFRFILLVNSRLLNVIKIIHIVYVII